MKIRNRNSRIYGGSVDNEFVQCAYGARTKFVYIYTSSIKLTKE